MSILQKIVFYLSVVAGTFFVLATLGSLIFSSSLWFLQLLNFPRLQVLMALIMCLILFFVGRKKWTIYSRLLLIGILLSISIQLYILSPYSLFTPPAVESVDPATVDKQAVFSILLANVLITNRHADELLKIVTTKDPTFLLTMEVNKRWINQLEVLNQKYPHRMIFPTENAYGMALYSKLPLNNPQIVFLNHKSVPTFKQTITLPNGQSFQLITVHPVAPTPSKYPNNTDGRKEVGLLKAGQIAAKRTLPTIVAGDFNDVGWSHNTRQFASISSLKDVRYGRGMYNTFDANSWIMRWPLDYVFTSGEFKVLNIERLPKFGSDHFPFYVQLALNPQPMPTP